MKATAILSAIAVAFGLGLVVGSEAVLQVPCLLPGTIREVKVNGVVWRGEPCDTAGVCIRYAKPVKGGR